MARSFIVFQHQNVSIMRCLQFDNQLILVLKRKITYISCLSYDICLGEYLGCFSSIQRTITDPCCMRIAS